MTRTTTTLIVLLLAFVSGAAALVYEVVFFRSLGLVFGVAVHAVAAVVGSFLLGLGLGAFAAGRLLGRVAPLRAYAIIEALIALFGYGAPFLFRELRRLADEGALPAGASFPALALLGSFLLLLWPTALMGATFPVLGRAIAAGSEDVATRVGWLYGINTLGACAGALVAAFAALPSLGMVGASHLAAGLNVALALSAWLLSSSPAFDVRPEPRGEADARRSGHRLRDDLSPARGLFAAVALIGFTSIALQVLANRLLISLLGGTVYVFGAVLAVFLLGVAAGGVFGGAAADRSPAPLRLLGRLAMGFGGAVGVGVLLLRWKAGGEDVLGGATNLALVPRGETVTEFTPLRYLRVAGVTTFVGLFAATFLSGAFLPAALRLAARSGGLARVLGKLYFWNTAGSIAGSIAAAFVLLPLLGLRASFALLLALPVVIGLVLSRAATLRGESASSASRFAIVAWLAAGAWGLVPGPPPGESEGIRTVFYRESAASSAKVVEFRDAAESEPVRSLFVSGKPVATSIFIDRRLQLLLGFISTLAHRDPRDMLCIGLGTGMTSGALAVAGGDLTVVEISDAVIGAAREFGKWNADLHHRADVTIVHDDGRSYLARTKQRFDVISADPIDPCVSGSAYLYTEEYYRLGRSRLKPGGLMSQWIPLYDLARDDVAGIVKTFRRAFPHATAWVTGYDLVLLGGDAAPAFDPREIGSRTSPEVAAMLASVGIDDASELLGCCFATETILAPFGDAAPRINTDEDPWIEFHAPRAAFGTYPLDVYRSLAESVDPPPLAASLEPPMRERILETQRRMKAAALEFVSTIETTRNYGLARTRYIERLRGP